MIDEKTVLKVAQIARINLTEEEAKKFAKDLQNVLEAFETLKSVDTKGVKPSFQPIEIKNVMRKDEVEKSLTQKQALSNTKNKESGYFKGPKAV